jgi:tagaturonate reductase
MQLSKKNLQSIKSETVAVPADTVFSLPEKVLQFGTGVLLRGLPDYFIDKANRGGVFNGRIVVVKSTGAGNADAFEKQDGLYTLCIRGIEEGKNVEQNIICSSISRVLSAKEQWNEILAYAHNPELTVIISNTTEVGIQLVEESIFQSPPVSFPAKLLAFLYERFKKFGENRDMKLVVLPTELISDNGEKLKSIVTELAGFNQLEAAFSDWLHQTVYFCNTLVDCIVPGRPEPSLHKQLESELGYEDALLAVSEVYRLWAIEGGDEIKTLLSFAEVDSRIIIAPDITKYKELKLRLLNGTHTLSCGLAHLAGIGTVREAMENQHFSTFVTNLMLHEIAPAIPYALDEDEAIDFGRQVLDRFRNPHLQHQWLSITLQYSSKMAMRIIPVLFRYIELHKTVPQHIATGIAAYLLFMKAVKQDGEAFWGECNGHFYPINDPQAGYYFELWQQNDVDAAVNTALQNETVWGTDLTKLDGFETAVRKKLHELQTYGALQTVARLTPAM